MVSRLARPPRARPARIITSNYGRDLEVKRGETLLVSRQANFEGTIVVDGGVVKLTDGATVEGDIICSHLGTVLVRNAIVEGDIKSSTGGRVSVCGSSRVGGDVKLEFNGDIEIADSVVVLGDIKGGFASRIVLRGSVKVDGDVKFERSRVVAVDGANIDGRIELVGVREARVTNSAISDGIAARRTSLFEQNNTRDGEPYATTDPAEPGLLRSVVIRVAAAVGKRSGAASSSDLVPTSSTKLDDEST